MSKASADKNIVDKSRNSRNAAIARTLRATRDRLQTDGERNVQYDREMMSMFISSAIQGAAAMPALVLLTAGFSMLFFNSPNVFAWTMAGLAAYALMAFMAKRADRQKITFESAKRWERNFIVAHGIAGLSWAVFAYQQCPTCNGEEFAFFKGIVLLERVCVE